MVLESVVCMPADPDKAIALTRLYVADTHDDPSKRLLSDQQVEALLEANSWSVYRTAAEALRIIATSEVLVSKVIRTQDLQTSGDRVAERLQSLANSYDAKADDEEIESDGAIHFIPSGGRGRLETEEYRGPWL